ncbi:MAG: aldo/keto reductase [Anaerolineales bacterium]|jgi:aryl-alcohol dehydrogenase-like predicted oxidoreductase
MRGTQLTKRTLGRTDLQVTPIGLGVMQFSGSAGFFRFMFDDIEQSQMDEIVRAALEGGINWFDTAEAYGGGRSERGLSRALQHAGAADQDVRVATKWMPVLRTASSIPRTIGKRLENLSPYTIDLYYVHQPWGFSPPESEMDAMADLVQAGKVRTVGVSNFNAEQMRRAAVALEKRGLKLAANQMQYSLVHRHIETNGVLEAARDLGVTIVAWGPLASGLLTGKFHRDPEALKNTPFVRRRRLRSRLQASLPLIEALERIGKRYDASPAQVALNWLIHFQGDVVVAIPGASKAQHAREAAGAMKFKLTQDELADLDHISGQLGG